MSFALNRLLRSLVEMGCAPWPAGDGHWFAECPTCREQGHLSLVEIRASETGIVVACVNAHEAPAATQRRRPAA